MFPPPLVRNLEFVTWNANGVKNKINDLRDFIEEQDLDLVLLTETHLNAGDRLRIRNFKTYRSDRVDYRGGGTAIIVRDNYDVIPLILPQTPGYETCGIILNISQNCKIKVISMYIPPGTYFDDNVFLQLFSGGMPVFLAGDFNSHHQSWYCRNSNRRGRELYNFTMRHNIRAVAPHSPTFFSELVPNSLPSVLDFALVKGLSFNIAATSLPELDSDHNPVLFDLDFLSLVKIRTV